jgi:hypothetical protein
MNHIKDTISDNRSKLVARLNFQRDMVKGAIIMQKILQEMETDEYYDGLIRKLKGGVKHGNRTTG